MVAQNRLQIQLKKKHAPNFIVNVLNKRSTNIRNEFTCLWKHTKYYGCTELRSFVLSTLTGADGAHIGLFVIG